MMNIKVQEYHTKKLAYVYLRQSTVEQIRFNQESTERQYALRNRAIQLGWEHDLIKLLDGDLGMSGSQSVNREDFKILIADVSMGKVGAIFAIEASRFSRSCTDWHRLLELCAMTDTLIVDEDGCYDPTDFNDQLLLGLKGTMSQAELHFMRARLLGGQLNKAKKGELKFILPIGFCHNRKGQIILDEDEQVRSVVALLFKTFKETGSAFKVTRYFNGNNISFPKRMYGGIWQGKLIWSKLMYGRTISILNNPSYAGVYVFGRSKHEKHISSNGVINYKLKRLQIDNWKFIIKDHHEAYISWEEYMENREKLRTNRTNIEKSVMLGPAREGLALLQGLLICGHCGSRIATLYQSSSSGTYPRYTCNRKKDGCSTNRCLSVNSTLIDKRMVQRVLEVIEPSQIDIAIKAFEEIEQRTKAIEKQWQMKIKRVEYESQLAQRRYEEVDPSNRLVAATIEKRWNETLLELEDLKKEYAEYQKKDILQDTEKHKNAILTIAQNFPKLWRSETTSHSDRKRILRLVINDITLERLKSSKEVVLHIRWHGGATEDIVITVPGKGEVRKHQESTIDIIRNLAASFTDQQIAIKLNEMGIRSQAKENIFTTSCIKNIRHKYKMPRPRGTEKEFEIKEIMIKFNVSESIVHYWIKKGIVMARHISGSKKLWITITSSKEEELYKLIANSPKIKKVQYEKTQSQDKVLRGVV